MYEREYAFYEANKQAIREKYLGKQIVVVGEEIVAAYDDLDKAYDETVKVRPLGSFMIHEVPVNIEDEVQYLSPFIYG